MGNQPSTFPLPESIITAILSNPDSGKLIQDDVVYTWQSGNVLYLTSTDGALSLATYHFNISPSSAGTPNCHNLSLTFVPTALQTDIINPKLYPNRCPSAQCTTATVSDPPSVSNTFPSDWIKVGDFCIDTTQQLIEMALLITMYQKPDGNYVTFFRGVNIKDNNLFFSGYSGCLTFDAYLCRQADNSIQSIPSSYMIVETDSNGKFINFINPNDYSQPILCNGNNPDFNLSVPPTFPNCAPYQIGFDDPGENITLAAKNISITARIRGCVSGRDVVSKDGTFTFSMVPLAYCTCGVTNPVMITSH